MNAVSLAGFILLMSSVPYWWAGQRRRNYLLWDATSWAILAALWSVSRVLEIRLEPSLAFALLVVSKLAVLATFLILHDLAGSWTANKAGVFAGALYLVLVPHLLRWHLDGDEAYYLLVTQSIAQDGDLDLRNQYQAIDRSATRRPDLRPQPGDPLGRRGEQYSRTEPFLSVLLLPGFAAAGLPGAVATIALFGGLLVRSTLLLMTEEGASTRAARVCFIFLALGPPVVFYATRLWPEVPAAFCLIEAVRGFRSGGLRRMIAPLMGLSLLKLRFLPIAATLLVLFFVRRRATWRAVVVALAVVTIPFIVLLVTTGRWSNVHELWELQPQSWWRYPRGLFGLILDAQAGILFQAPFFAVALTALVGWREVLPSARAGLLACVPYLILLVPRDEWHGGWSPPLRYLVVLLPLLPVATARLLDRTSPAILAFTGVLTAALTTHALAFPWRLFHIAGGESLFGEYLSARYGADFSRMLPSFIRPNFAAVIASLLFSCVLLALLLLRRSRNFSRVARNDGALLVALFTLALALWFREGLKPGAVVHFEDRHVVQHGGELFPHQWTVARFLYTGGWRLRPGDQLSFRYRGGDSRLSYLAEKPSEILVDSRPVALPVTPAGFNAIQVPIARSDSHTIVCLSGEVILDRIGR